MILHQVQTSPAQGNALTTCLRYITPADSLVLTGNAVTALLQDKWRERLAAINVLLLKDDVQARGLTDKLSQYKMIDYDDFVLAATTHNKVITW